MGMGQMTIPLFISTLPEGMTLTIDEITKDTPSGMWANISLPNNMSFPHTFTTQEIKDGKPSNNRGAKVAELQLRTDGAFDSGNGGSFLVRFTIKGRPDECPDADVQDTKGQLTIGTSQWGVISRPDQTNFSWTIENKSQTYTAETPTLAYLDDSCMVLSYVPEKKAYVFGVSNQQELIVKIMQGAVSTIIAGHKALYSTAAGWVCSIGGAAVAVVAFGASFVDGI